VLTLCQPDICPEHKLHCRRVIVCKHNVIRISSCYVVISRIIILCHNLVGRYHRFEGTRREHGSSLSLRNIVNHIFKPQNNNWYIYCCKDHESYSFIDFAKQPMTAACQLYLAAGCSREYHYEAIIS
jgi:hypothetical protein